MVCIVKLVKLSDRSDLLNFELTLSFNMFALFLGSIASVNVDPEIGWYYYDSLPQSDQLPFKSVNVQQFPDVVVTIPLDQLASYLINNGLLADNANNFQKQMKFAKSKRIFFHTYRFGFFKTFKSGALEHMQCQFHKTKIFASAVKNADGSITLVMRRIFARAPTKHFVCGAKHAYGAKAYCFPQGAINREEEDRRNADEVHAWMESQIADRFNGLY